MRQLLDSENKDLREVLEGLLADDTDITAREVARRHPTLRNASAFTRNPPRLALIEQARQRQIDARHVRSNPGAKRSASLSELLEERNRQVAVLEAQVTALVASHAACVRAVIMHGGIQALERFWRDYKVIADTVHGLDAVPGGADIVELPLSEGRVYLR